MADSKLQQLSKRGQSVWIDSLSRTMIESGKLEQLMSEDAVVGVTTNPSIFQKALAEGGAYDAQLREIAKDGFVSWEVDPTLAYDREGTFDQAMRLHAWIERPNLYVKIPATKAGL